MRLACGFGNVNGSGLVNVSRDLIVYRCFMDHVYYLGPWVLDFCVHYIMNIYQCKNKTQNLEFKWWNLYPEVKILFHPCLLIFVWNLTSSNLSRVSPVSLAVVMFCICINTSLIKSFTMLMLCKWCADMCWHAIVTTQRTRENSIKKIYSTPQHQNYMENYSSL